MSKKLTLDEFIDRAVFKHGTKYNYSNVNYINSNTKVQIFCEKHNNIFEQTPIGHFRGSGCVLCEKENVTLRSRIKGKLKFLKESKKLHGGKYNYNMMSYKTIDDKVKIYCKKHKLYFEQIPYNHMNGSNCNICVNEDSILRQSHNTSIFVQRATLLNKTKYLYHDVNYVTALTKVKIFCTTCGVSFLQKPAEHLDGHGCASCSFGGFKFNKPAVLYYLSILGGIAYKVGITNRSVKDRFTHLDSTKIKILQTISYINGKEAYLAEQTILKEFEYAKYMGVDLLSSGNSELFYYDVLGLDSIPN